MLAWSWQTDYMLFALVRDCFALRRLGYTDQLSERQDRRASGVLERAKNDVRCFVPRHRADVPSDSINNLPTNSSSDPAKPSDMSKSDGQQSLKPRKINASKRTKRPVNQRPSQTKRYEQVRWAAVAQAAEDHCLQTDKETQ